MLDILTIVYSFADIQTASRIRRTCRRLAALTTEPVLYSKPYPIIEYEYRVGDKLHRLDGPARVYVSGHTSWYRGGIAHREYHPHNTSEIYRGYCVDGVYHREAGPSIIRQNEVTWYLRGMLHRKTGSVSGYVGSWYTLGKSHRLDGPAYGNIYAIRGVEHSIFCAMANMWVVGADIIRE